MAETTTLSNLFSKIEEHERDAAWYAQEAEEAAKKADASVATLKARVIGVMRSRDLPSVFYAGKVYHAIGDSLVAVKCDYASAIPLPDDVEAAIEAASDQLAAEGVVHALAEAVGAPCGCPMCVDDAHADALAGAVGFAEIDGETS